MEQHQHCVDTTITKEAVNPLGQPGPFVKVRRLMNTGDVVVDWYTPEVALQFAENLRLAALS